MDRGGRPAQPRRDHPGDPRGRRPDRLQRALIRPRLRPALAALLLAVLAAGCAGPAEPLPAPAGETIHPVWVVDHGWHTGLVVRAADVPAGLWPERADFPDAPYLEVAWGDREFYMAPRGTLWLALKAAVASGGSVLHVVALPEPPARYFAGREVVEVPVTRAGLQALARFVDAAHARQAGRAPRLGPGLYGDGAFYPAVGRYSLASTCNTWIADALRAAGCPTDPGRAATAGALLRQAREVRCGAS